MKSIRLDSISTVNETSGLIINSCDITLLEGEHIIRIFATDKSSFIITAMSVTETYNVYYIITNDVRSIAYDEIIKPGLSDDGKALLLIYRLGNEWFITSKDKISGPYDEVKNCCYAYNGDISIFECKINGQWKLISRHKILEELNKPSNLIFSQPLMSNHENGFDCYNINKDHKSCYYLITEKDTYGPFESMSVLYYNNNRSCAVVFNDEPKKEFYVLYDDIIEGPFIKAPSALRDLLITIPPVLPENKTFSFQFTGMTDKGSVIYDGHKKTDSYREIINIAFNIYGRSLYAAAKKYRDALRKDNLIPIKVPKNNHLQDESLKNIWILIDDEEFGPYDNVIGPFQYPESGDICYFAERDSLIYLYDINGIISGPYTGLQGGYLMFYLGRLLLSYHVEIDGLWYYVHNGLYKGPFDGIGFIHYNRDTGIDIFTAEIGGLFHVIIGDKQYGPYEEVARIGLKLYNNTYRYIARVKQRWYIFTEYGRLVIDIPTGFLGFDCDDTVLINITNDSMGVSLSEWYIIIENKLQGPYKRINGCKTKNGTITGYEIESFEETENDFKIQSGLSEIERKSYTKSFQGKTSKYYKRYLMIRGKIYGPYDRCTVHGFLNDEILIATVHSDGNDFLLSGDTIYGPYKEITNFAFTSSNEKFAYSAIKGDNYYIYSDVSEFGSFENVNLIQIVPLMYDFLFLYSTYKSVEFILFRGKIYGPFSFISQSDILRSSDGKTISFSTMENKKLKNYIFMNDELIHGILSSDGNTAYILKDPEALYEDNHQ